MTTVAGAAAEPVLADPLDTTARIETPEHVRFDYQIAGPARRCLAYLLDTVFILVALIMVGIVVGVATAIDSQVLSGVSNGLYLVFAFFVWWFYFTLFETLWSGRSPGKRILRLRVVREGGHPLTFLDSFLRNLLRAADMLPGFYGVGLLVMSYDPHFRRFGDMVAGTMVVVEQRRDMSAALTIHPPPTPAELEALPQRPPVSRDDLDAIELFLRRRPRLSAGRELELAQMIAPVYAHRMGVRYRDPSRFLALVYHRANQRGAS